MKKALAIAALCCAAMGVNAEVYEYDFNTSPSFFPYLQAPVEELGMGQTGNFDFLDKNGRVNAVIPGADGELLQYKDEEGAWHASEKPVRVSLGDGCAYYADENGKWTFEGEEMDYSEPFLTYDSNVGPARVTWMAGWGTLDAWVDENYNAIDADNWVATKHGMGFLRNSNSGSRKDTYIQVPEVDGAATITVWAGHAGSSYTTELRVKIVPIVDGVKQPAFCYYKPLEETVAKRYYKLTIDNLDKNVNAETGERNYADAYAGGGKVAYMIGCAGSELHIYHVKIETDNSGLNDVIAAPADENAPVYNILGQRVNENYKGIVIKNGVKYIQK